MPPDQPLPNEPEARTPTGELKNQTSTTPSATETTTSTTEPKAEPKTEPKVEPKAEPKADDKKVAAGAPEKYTDFTVPDGFELDPAVATEFTGIAKELNLDQASAQKLVDFHVAKTKEAANAPFDAWKTMTDGWLTELKADPEIGGRLEQVHATVNKAIDGLGDAKLAEAFRETMNLTGAGNHPAFVKAFYKLAQKVTEGTHVPGGGPVDVKQPGGSKPSIASAMFPNLKTG